MLPIRLQNKFSIVFVISSLLILCQCGVPNFIEEKVISEVFSDPDSGDPVDPSEEPENPPIIDPDSPETLTTVQDSFIHNVPHGGMEILFVFHNKKKMRPFIQRMQEQSAIFLAALVSSPLTEQYDGELSFKLNAVTSSSPTFIGDDVTAENAFYAGGNTFSDKLKAIPIADGDGDNLSIDMLLQVLGAGFILEGNSRFFPFIISNSDYAGATSLESIVSAVQEKKSASLIHPFGLFFSAGTDVCNSFEYRRAFFLKNVISSLGGANQELCLLETSPASIIEHFMSNIYQQMSRKVLSSIPVIPTMKVYINSIQVDSDHWTYHVVQNEVTLKASAFAQIGDKVTVVYEL